MPELPEVEGMKQRLSRIVVGSLISDVRDISGTATRSTDGTPFRDAVVGLGITAFDRRAKNLLVSLSNGDGIVMHFMREGMLEYAPTGAGMGPHTQAVMTLDTGYELRLRDTMRTARWTLCPGNDTSKVSTLQKLGPEYTDKSFTPDYLKKRLDKKSPLKALLVDQSVIAGIGNAYAHEIAFEAGIRPDRAGNSLSGDEIVRIYRAIGLVFDRAIAARAASTLSVMGDEGWEVARIHRRKGQSCPVCGTTLLGEKLGGNLVYYCPNCQH